MADKRRSHKRMDPAFKALKQSVMALHGCPEYMRLPTLRFLWDKFVTHAKPARG